MSAVTENQIKSPVLRVRFSGQPENPGLNELFRFTFDEQAQSATRPAPAIHVALQVLGGSCQDEIWECDEPVEAGMVDDIAYAESVSLLMLHINVAITDGSNIGGVTEYVYSKLLDEASKRGFPDIARTWNFIPDINSGAGDSERYRQFSSGRAQAFETRGYDTAALPAGTAIGSAPDTPLHITILCSRGNCKRIENPRQVSAYEYPRQYGPRSPSFSRAVLLDTAEPLLLISGTASILGHKSMHTDQLVRQGEETTTNILTLREAADESAGLTHSSDAGCLRLYLRRAEDFSEAVQSMHGLLSEGCHLIALRGDICRSDLLLEVEAVYREQSC